MDSPEYDNDAVVMQRITIEKVLKGDGEFIWRCNFEDLIEGSLIPYLDGLGLMEAAKADFKDHHEGVGPYADNG